MQKVSKIKRKMKFNEHGRIFKVQLNFNYPDKCFLDIILITKSKLKEKSCLTITIGNTFELSEYC